MKPKKFLANNLYNMKGMNGVDLLFSIQRENGELFFTTCWKLTPEEIKHIQLTEEIFIVVRQVKNQDEFPSHLPSVENPLELNVGGLFN